MNAFPGDPRQRLLELVQAQLPRPKAAIGTCSACQSAVRAEDNHVRLRGEVYHSRCARYGGRGPSL
jgi:hypothetical protein